MISSVSDIGKTWMKQPLRTVFRTVGGPGLLRLWQQRSVRILGYHTFTESTAPLLESHCKYLRRHYNPVSLTEAINHLNDSRPLPPRMVVFTVDDGYRDFLKIAHPILSRYQIPATVFLVSDFVDKKCWLWFDQISFAFEHTRKKEAVIQFGAEGPMLYSLETVEERRAGAFAVSILAKKVPNVERVRLVREVATALEVVLPDEPPPEMASLNWDEARWLARRGVDFGCHTKTHPILSRLSSAAEVRGEIVIAKEHIEKELGRRVTHFCYPNGGEADFDNRAIAVLEESGFQTAVTATIGLNVPGDPPLRLKRIFMETDVPQWLFEECIDGRWRIYQGEHQSGNGL
jgi:peptidoglycan/xylan/chitin deacetylase (PgdA/CDA1 family)